MKRPHSISRLYDQQEGLCIETSTCLHPPALLEKYLEPDYRRGGVNCIVGWLLYDLLPKRFKKYETPRQNGVSYTAGGRGGVGRSVSLLALGKGMSDKLRKAVTTS